MNTGATLFVFAGRTGSGKTSISKPFAEGIGAKWTSFGNAVRSEAMRLGQSHEDKGVLQLLGQQLVEEQPDRLCDLVLSLLAPGDGTVGVLDGLRHGSIFEQLISRVGRDRVRLIFVSVEEGTRHQRLMINRGWSLRQCREYDNNATEWELDSVVRPLADLVVNNDDSIESSMATIHQWLSDNVEVK